MDCKVCRDCGVEKMLEDFHRAGKSVDGHSIYCKPCNNLRRRLNKQREVQPDYKPQRIHIKIEDGKKRCSRCRERKPIAEFVMSNGQGLLHGYCKPCHAAWAREYNRQPQIRERVSKQSKARKFGITVKELDRMEDEQDGKCAICRGVGGVHGLCVDHDHRTGCVRSLLCSSCNAGIAMMKHDPSLLRAAADYVETWGSIIAATSRPAI